MSAGDSPRLSTSLSRPAAIASFSRSVYGVRGEVKFVRSTAHFAGAAVYTQHIDCGAFAWCRSHNGIL
jgi:hypothetical protein